MLVWLSAANLLLRLLVVWRFSISIVMLDV